MEINTQKSQNKKKKITDNNIFRLFVALIVLAACAGLGAGIAILEDKSDPTSYVGAYFGKFLTQNYEAMYEYVDLEGVYAPKDAYVRFMEQVRSEHNIGEYEFGQLEKAGKRYRMSISYSDIDTGEKRNFDVYLIRHRDSWKQLVADWKISIDEYIVSDYSVEVPKGMKLELDGKVVDDNYISIGASTGDIIDLGEGETFEIILNNEADNNNTDTIRIHNIIRGTYKARAINDYTQIAKEITVLFDKQQQVMDVAELKVRDEHNSLVEANAPAMIQEFYSVVRKKKTTSEALRGFFVPDEKVAEELKKTAKKNQKVLFWEEIEKIDNYKVQSCNFSELQYTTEHIGDNKIKAVYQFAYDYLLSTETELYSSYVETLSGKCNTTMEITYIVADGSIKVADLKIKNDNQKDIIEEE